MRPAFAASGPGIRRLGKPITLSNLDIAPTVLNLLGVKPLAPMEGKVLKQILMRK